MSACLRLWVITGCCLVKTRRPFLDYISSFLLRQKRNPPAASAAAATAASQQGCAEGQRGNRRDDAGELLLHGLPLSNGPGCPTMQVRCRFAVQEDTAQRETGSSNSYQKAMN